MNATIAKLLRKFARMENLDYNGVKNDYEARTAIEQQQDIKWIKALIKLKGGDKKNGKTTNL